PIPVLLVVDPGVFNDILRLGHANASGECISARRLKLPLNCRNQVKVVRSARLVVLSSRAIAESESEVLLLPAPDQIHRAFPLTTIAAVFTVASRIPPPRSSRIRSGFLFNRISVRKSSWVV